MLLMQKIQTVQICGVQIFSLLYLKRNLSIQQLQIDIMALYYHLINSMFCMFMANLYWQKITFKLFQEQNAINRPDIIGRIFYIK